MCFTIGKWSACAALFAAGLAFAETATAATLAGLPSPVVELNAWTFEPDLCGRLPQGWWGWGAKAGELENSRWVSNAASVAGRQSFLIDFSHLPPVSRAGESPTGYTSCRLKPATNGWAVISFCFRREEGKPLVEVRGPHRGGMFYQILGFELAEDVRFLTAAGKDAGRAIVGRAPVNAWRRVSLCFPLENASPREAYVRFDTRRGDGGWQDGAWMCHPMGEVVLTGAPNQINLLGYGRQKIFLDNFCYGVTPQAPSARAVEQKKTREVIR